MYHPLRYREPPGMLFVVRATNKEKEQERRNRIFRQGKCRSHVSEDVVPGKRYCPKCAVSRNVNRIAREQRRKALGVCVNHESQAAAPGRTLCAMCLSSMKKAQKKASEQGKCPRHPRSERIAGGIVCKDCVWYGITKRTGWTCESYSLAYIKQGGRCALCDRSGAMVGTGTRLRETLVGDHDHGSGLPRGLLCLNCNTALGHLGEDLSRIRKFASRVASYISPPQGEIEELPLLKATL